MAEKAVNKEALKKVEDQLDCAICLQPYTDPKLLPCFHVFCKHCLERIVVRNRDGSTVTCPKCRRLTPLTANGVGALQSAFHINHLFDIRDTLEKAKQPQKTQCEKCKKAMATGFCRDCGEFVCEKCIELHQLWKEFTEHQIVSLSKVQEEASSLAPLTRKVLYCSKHAKQELKIYCETCKELICTDCTIRLHLGHQYDLVTDTFPKHRDEIQAHLQPVRQQLEKVNTALRAMDTRTKEIGDQGMAIEANIHTTIDQLHQALDQRRAELVGQLHQITQQKLKSLAAQKDQTEVLQAQLTSCLEYVEGSLTTSTPAEILGVKEPVIKQIQGVLTELNHDSLAPKEEANIKLVADDLEKRCRTFGTILTRDPKVDPTQCHIVGDAPKHVTVGERVSVTLQTVDEEGKEFSVPVQDISAELVRLTDHTCQVKEKEKGKYTIMYTPATRGRHQLHIKVCRIPLGCSPLLVVVKLPPQRLGNPVQTIANVTDPRGVALDSRGQILVSEKGKNEVSVYSLHGQKVKTHTFSKTNVPFPWGICSDSGDKILVASYTGQQIHQFTPNGEHLRSIGSLSSNPLQFCYPTGIAYSSKSRKFYISEVGNSRVQVLNEDLSFSATFGTKGSGNGQLADPRGVAIDSRGNVYVAEHSNNRIQVFTPEGQSVRALGTKGAGPGQLDRPQDVYIDRTDTVYVADFGNGRISVFTTQGQFLTSFGQGHLSQPIGLTMDEDGFIIVSDYSKKQVLLF